MRPMKPDPGIRVQAVRIPTENGGMSALLLSPQAFCGCTAADTSQG